MKNKHTPGPWRMTEYKISTYTITAAPQNAIRIDSEYSDQFVDIYSGTNDTEDELYEEAIANAKLIAAAPDMLEALESIQDMLYVPGLIDAGNLRRITESAIKKATGDE